MCTCATTQQLHTEQPCILFCCRLLFPLNGVQEGTPLLVELLAKDFAGAQFLGQVGAARVPLQLAGTMLDTVQCESGSSHAFHVRGAFSTCCTLRQVIMTLGKALDIASSPTTGLAYWWVGALHAQQQLCTWQD